jgi:two-component system, OmpR family, KDP operon response regulator KdpE
MHVGVVAFDVRHDAHASRDRRLAAPSRGRSGLSDAAIHPPDVVVLDLGFSLPDVDGMQVCSRLRSCTDTPVIVLSADGSEYRKVEALNGGADDYVTKPFGMRELDARLRVALRHHTTEETEHTTRLDAGPLHSRPAAL